LISSDSKFAFASIAEIGKLFRSRKLSPVELTRFLLARIERLNPTLNAFITVSADLALKQASKAENELAKGKGRSPRHDRGPLHGIPFCLKDNIFTAGVRTTAGSRILAEFVPTENAPVVSALYQAGAVLLGKTNMHEFAYGATNNNPHYGQARNPWDPERISGGSSGGSAVALAAGLSFAALGTDTGGSVRIPSSLCGVVGLKTSLDAISTRNVIPLSTSLDVVGPMARTAADVSLVFDAIRPAASAGDSVGFARFNPGRVRKPRLGIPREFFFDVTAPDIAASFNSAIRLLRKDGARLKKVSLPLVEKTEEAGNQIAWAEALLYHQQSGWYPARAAEYGEDVRFRLELGTKVSAVTYLEALQTRERFMAAFNSMLFENELDALVVPTTPIAATLIDEDSVLIDGNSQMTRALLLRLNRPANLAGIPAISVPCGFTKSNLPVGIQFIGPLNSDLLLLAIARHFEKLHLHGSDPRVPFPGPFASN
jgi:aspartyl-tRNA(Asn)/glutamyl-tRNA(Gln) amidotransferase subunit A